MLTTLDTLYNIPGIIYVAGENVYFEQHDNTQRTQIDKCQLNLKNEHSLHATLIYCFKIGMIVMSLCEFLLWILIETPDQGRWAFEKHRIRAAFTTSV